LIDAVETVAAEWLKDGDLGAAASIDSNWNFDQKKILLETLISAVDHEGPELLIRQPHVLDRIDKRYGFSITHNCELTYSWCLLCLKAGDLRKLDLVVRFLSEQGRMKFIRPLYQQLHKGGGVSKQAAQSTFEKHRKQYHAIAAKMIARDLELAP
jgi:leukotriene-A4 hydrolase